MFSWTFGSSFALGFQFLLRKSRHLKSSRWDADKVQIPLSPSHHTVVRMSMGTNNSAPWVSMILQDMPGNLTKCRRRSLVSRWPEIVQRQPLISLDTSWPFGCYRNGCRSPNPSFPSFIAHASSSLSPVPASSTRPPCCALPAHQSCRPRAFHREELPWAISVPSCP